MNKLQWETYIPLYRNRFILQGLGIAIGIPFGTLILFIIIIAKGNIMGTDAKYALFSIGLLFVFSYIITMIIYGGKYAPGFIIDNNGITNYTQEEQYKRNKVINSLLIVLGLFGNNYTAAGAGFMAQSKQVMQIKWNRVTKIKYYPKQHTIIVKGGFAEKIAVFCTKENYHDVETMIRTMAYRYTPIYKN